MSPGIGWLIGARAVQGAGSALIMPLGLALLTEAFLLLTPAGRRIAEITAFLDPRLFAGFGLASELDG